MFLFFYFIALSYLNILSFHFLYLFVSYSKSYTLFSVLLVVTLESIPVLLYQYLMLINTLPLHMCAYTHTHAHICLSMFVKAQGNISKDISQLSTGWQGAGVWYWGGEVGGFILLFTVVHVHTKLWPNISLHYCTLHIYIVLYCTLTLYNSFLHLLQCILNTVPCP